MMVNEVDKFNIQFMCSVEKSKAVLCRASGQMSGNHTTIISFIGAEEEEHVNKHISTEIFFLFQTK